jgi:beta-phosphoglucomutase
MKPHGVIFDMDGVLVDSTEAHFQSWKAIGDEVGQPYSRELFLKTYGMHNRQSVPLWLGRSVDEEELKRLADRKEELYRQMARQTLKPIPGVKKLVRALATDEFRLAVGTSGPAANVLMALEILNLTEYFKVLSTGDDVQEGKPNPAIFLNAARKLNLSPIRCAVIEDAPQGIAAAKAANMFVIAIPTSRAKEELSGADWVADSLDDIAPAELRSRWAI